MLKNLIKKYFTFNTWKFFFIANKTVHSKLLQYEIVIQAVIFTGHLLSRLGSIEYSCFAIRRLPVEVLVVLQGLRCNDIFV